MICKKEKVFLRQRGTTHIVWLKGRGPLTSLAGLNVIDCKISGMARTELLRVTHKKPKFPSNAWEFDVTVKGVKVPNNETTYWCRVFKLPSPLKQK